MGSENFGLVSSQRAAERDAENREKVAAVDKFLEQEAQKKGERGSSAEDVLGSFLKEYKDFFDNNDPLTANMNQQERLLFLKQLIFNQYIEHGKKEERFEKAA
jgi:hypothetical protein